MNCIPFVSCLCIRTLSDTVCFRIGEIVRVEIKIKSFTHAEHWFRGITFFRTRLRLFHECLEKLKTKYANR